MRSILIFALLLMGGPAQAALVDNGTYTTDTNAGLDWLDFHYSQKPALQWLAENPGWRLPTESEVTSLFTTLFDGFYATGPDGWSRTTIGSTEDAYDDQLEDIGNFMDLFGLTGGGEFSTSQYIYGMYLDDDNIWRVTGAYTSSGLTSGIQGLDASGDLAYYAENGHRNYSTFLVRTSVVPVPAAAWLFGSALAGLGWLRRKPAV